MKRFLVFVTAVILLPLVTFGSAFAATWYRDADRDGYGDPNITKTASTKPWGYVSNNLDCNDSNHDINPVAVELCDGIDNNCNSVADDACTSFVPSQYPTIQAAIDATPEGCTVLVDEGDYYENINFNGKAITVISDEGAEDTIINGGANGSVVTMNSGEITGFTITNGYANGSGYGGGINASGSSVTISDCAIIGNTAGYAGGGISIDNGYQSSNISIDNCSIANNTSLGIGGGGVNIIMDPNSVNSAIVSNCSITGNASLYGGGLGCGGWWNYVAITIDNCTITGNTASINGGGLNLWYATANIIGGNISGNTPNDILIEP